MLRLHGMLLCSMVAGSPPRMQCSWCQSQPWGLEKMRKNYIDKFAFQPCLNTYPWELTIYIASWDIISVAIFLTHSDTCWSCYWTTCYNVWWSRAGAGCTVVSTRVRGLDARTEEDIGPVHLSILCYISNCGTAAVAWDAPRRSSPGVGHCHWSVYLRAHHCDAGEVEASGGTGVDTSGWSACDVHPRSRNWERKK